MRVFVLVPETGLAHMFSRNIFPCGHYFSDCGPAPRSPMVDLFGLALGPRCGLLVHSRQNDKRPCSKEQDLMSLVPETGLEPARVTPHAPKASVSTNSTTPASFIVKKLTTSARCLVGSGRTCPPGRIRTYDRLVKSQLLYQLSYERMCSEFILTSPLLQYVTGDNLSWFFSEQTSLCP